MKYGQILGIDKPASRVAQGSVMLTKQADVDYSHDFELLDAVYEAGINLFDSAHVYNTDRPLGAWIRQRGLRDKVVLMDKVCHHDQNGRRVTPEAIDQDLAELQERLGFEYIDILTFHRDDPSVPFEPVIERMNALIEAGTIGAFGASNWKVDRIRAANEWAAANGLRGFACASMQYSLVHMMEPPWAESWTITGPDNRAEYEYFRDTQMPMLNWSSLAGGFLAGPVTRADADDPDKAKDIPVRCYGSADNWTRLDRARELAEAKSVTVAQIALAYVLCGEINCFPLMAARTPAEATNSAAAVDIDLTADELAYLDLRD